MFNLKGRAQGPIGPLLYKDSKDEPKDACLPGLRLNIDHLPNVYKGKVIAIYGKVKLKVGGSRLLKVEIGTPGLRGSAWPHVLLCIRTFCEARCVVTRR